MPRAGPLSTALNVHLPYPTFIMDNSFKGMVMADDSHYNLVKLIREGGFWSNVMPGTLSVMMIWFMNDFYYWYIVRIAEKLILVYMYTHYTVC